MRCWLGFHADPVVGRPEIDMGALFEVFQCSRCGRERWVFIRNLFGHPPGYPRNLYTIRRHDGMTRNSSRARDV